MPKYRVLNKQVFTKGDHSILPIRSEDRYDIMHWRNEQMYHLRQNAPLTEAQQDHYFKEVIAPLFEQEQPDQILFSYMENNQCIGYGGLVHINWHDQHAEISFIMKTSLEKDTFHFHWQKYLDLIEEVAFGQLGLHKIFVYSYDIRPHLHEVLKSSGYFEDARLKDHCLVEGEYKDVLIHSKMKSK